MRLFFALTLVLTAAGAALAADAPKRKSGLWEIKFSNAQARGGQTIQQCVDQQSDDLMKNKMTQTENMSCTRNDMRKEGDKLVADSVCKIDGSTATTHAVFTGRFDSAYRADIKSTYEPPLHGMRESSSVIEAKWLGACLAGQKPGDIIMPGMPNINMDELMKKGMKNQ